MLMKHYTNLLDIKIKSASKQETKGLHGGTRTTEDFSFESLTGNKFILLV